MNLMCKDAVKYVHAVCACTPSESNTFENVNLWSSSTSEDLTTIRLHRLDAWYKRCRRCWWADLGWEARQLDPIGLAPCAWAVGRFGVNSSHLQAAWVLARCATDHPKIASTPRGIVGSVACSFLAMTAMKRWSISHTCRISPSEPCCKGKSFGRMLLDEITERLSKAGQYLLLRCQLYVKRRSVQIFLDTFDSMKTGPLTTHVKPKVHATSPCEASESWPLSKVILGGFGAGGTAALLGLLFPQLGGLVYLGSKVGKLGFFFDGFPGSHSCWIIWQFVKR